MYRIAWARKAQKQLLKIAQGDQGNIVNAVETLAHFPDCHNVKALTHHAYAYRLRVGRYRIFFNVDNGVKIVFVQEVKKRDERTY